MMKNIVDAFRVRLHGGRRRSRPAAL